MARWALQPITNTGVVPVGDTTTSGPVIRYVGAAAPTASAWNVNDLWVDTTTESTAQVLRRWTGTAFAPARSSAPLINDLFTGTDGAAWNSSNWALGANPTTGTGYGATISTNRGKLTTSNSGSYLGTARISRKVNLADRADINCVFSFTFDSTECYPTFLARSNSTLDTSTGYVLGLDKGSFYVGKIASFTTTLLTPTGGVAYGYGDGIKYSCRFRVVGTTIQARVWTATDPEPSTWGYSGTDSTITAAGAFGIALGTGSAATSSSFYFDDFTLESS